jgi:hypothetical protein
MKNIYLCKLRPLNLEMIQYMCGKYRKLENSRKNLIKSVLGAQQQRFCISFRDAKDILMEMSQNAAERHREGWRKRA